MTSLPAIMQMHTLVFAEPVPVMDERVLWVFLVHRTVGTGLQTRDLLESHVPTVMSVAGYKVTHVLVLSFSYMPLCRLQLSPVIWRSPLILISISSIKEKLCCNNAVVSACITAVSHGSCILPTSSRRCFRCSVERGRVVISASDCFVVLSGRGPGMAQTGVEVS